MVILDFTQTYVNLAALLLICSGGLIWLVDRRLYDNTNLTQEKVWSERLAFISAATGVLLFIMRWAYLNWFR